MNEFFVKVWAILSCVPHISTWFDWNLVFEFVVSISDILGAFATDMQHNFTFVVSHNVKYFYNKTINLQAFQHPTCDGNVVAQIFNIQYDFVFATQTLRAIYEQWIVKSFKIQCQQNLSARSISLKVFNANLIAFTSMNIYRHYRKKQNGQCLHLPLKVKLSLPHDLYSVIEGSPRMRKTASCSISGKEKEINFYITIFRNHSEVRPTFSLRFSHDSAVD